MTITRNNPLNKNTMRKTQKDKHHCGVSVQEYCFMLSRTAIKAKNGAFWLKMLQKVIKQPQPKCYISGAITHHDLKERMDTFDRAAAVLEKAGYTPVNPFKNGVPQAEHWTKHMRSDIGLLVQCDCIYMLKGWELSKGAKLEFDVANSCGIKVLFEH